MSSIVSIVGLGGGGCKVVDRLTSGGGGFSSVIAINTDSEGLAASKAAVKLQIGASHTGGLGCGGDVNLGKMAGESDVEMITELFTGSSLVFLVVALGGGTGTGAASIVLNAARDAGATTVCFATLPFSFEGQQRRAQAGQAVAGILASADLLVTVPNDKLFESVGDTRVVEAFRKADEVLSSGIGAVYKLVTNPGFINIDIADLRKIIETSGGVSNFGYGEGSGKGAAKKAVSLLLKNPLVDGGDVISRARSMIVSIVGGSDLAIKDIGDIMDAIKLQAPKDCNISMGTVIEDRPGDSISVAVIASDTRISEVTTETSEDIASNSREKAGSQWWQSKRHGKSKELQAKLSLEPSGKGRFKNVEPTILNGEDFDIPTFIRRRIVVER